MLKKVKEYSSRKKEDTSIINGSIASY